MFTSAQQYFCISSTQPSSVTQLFIIIPWLFFISPSLFDVGGTGARLVAGFRYVVVEFDSLLNRTLFTRSTRKRASFGEIVSACLIASLLLPASLGLAVCVYIVQSITRLVDTYSSN